MRKLAILVFLFAASALGGGGINVDTSKRFEFTDCSASGSSSQTVTSGNYLLRFTDEDVYLCWAATCSSAGERFPTGMAMIISIGAGGQVFSCRSAGATGDAIFTRANQ